MTKLVKMLMCALLLCTQLMAQTRTVKGKVTDDKNAAVANAAVVVKGTNTGTTTAEDGSFTLQVGSSATTLVVTSLGFAAQEISLGSSNSYSVTLRSSTENLDEVVVTAYGTTKKKAFTGTATTINADKFKDLQTTSITQVLQGQASGVLAVQSNGQPGESPTIRIRGVGSYSASSDPLILLDGAPYGGNINGINPSDIESITVLKDASSTSLYGSRAANGILQITTKTGKGTPKVSVSAVTGYSDRAVNDYSYVSSQQIYELTWEALRNEAILTPTLVSGSGSASAEDYASKTVAGKLVYNPYVNPQPIGLDGKLKTGLAPLWNQDWADALLRTGVRKDLNMNISGGNDKTKYLISGGYLDDQGIAVESKFKRYTGRLKLDTKVNDWLTAGINMNLAYSTQNYPAQGGSSFSNVIGWIRTVSSLYPVYILNPATGTPILDGNGNKQYDFGNNGPLLRTVLTPGNPAATTSMNPTSYNRFTTSANTFVEAQITRRLKFRSQYALDYYQLESNTYYNPFVGDGAAYAGRSAKGREVQTTQTFTNLLTYDNTWGIHHINAVLGMEAYRFHDGLVSAEARGFTFPGVTELAYGSTPYTATSAAYDNRMASYFTRINYDITDKYHLSASGRRDGTSRFADSVRWGTFWSVGAAWSVSREDFMKGITVISDLKLRASYGTSGNQSTVANGGATYFPYLSSYTSGANIAGYAGSIINVIGNPNLQWEAQKTLDLGIDFGLFNNRLTGSFTYFERKSDKLLFAVPAATSGGVPPIFNNAGQFTNKGFEIDLTSVNIRKRNFEWTTSFNLSHIKNNIAELPFGSFAGSNFSQITVGQSMYNFYMREYAGVDAADGRPQWYMDDAANPGKRILTKTYSSATRYYLGTSLPDWTGGMSNTVRFRNFDLSFLVSFSIGGKIYDGDYAGLNYAVTGTTAGYNWSTDILGRWQSTANPGDGRTPKLTSVTDYQGNSASSRFLYDASYARVRNITIGYRLPKSLLDKAKFTNARFYVDCQNPFTFYGRKGLDPESGIAGITSNTSSAYRTISVGVNFDF
jgi:TonB-linked SusC/RagA family outer membrane protein